MSLIRKTLNSVLGLSFLVAASAQASDHIDCVNCDLFRSSIPVANDLTDLFAWTPAPGRLAIAVNTHLAASSKSRFSENAVYRLRIKKIFVAKSRTDLNIPLQGSDSTEVTVECTFKKDEAENSKQIATCEIPGTNVKLSTKVNEVKNEDTSSIRLFAGLRADPFILDIAWGEKFTRMTALKELPDNSAPAPLEKPTNFSDYFNVLNITLELPVKEVLGENVGLVAVAADVGSYNDSHQFIIQDRVGRPELTNITIRVPEIKTIHNIINIFDLDQTVYNEENVKLLEKWYARLPSPFKRSPKNLLTYFIAAGVNAWDKLDHKADWSSEELYDFTKILFNDYLVVNTEKVCEFGKPSYLDIELGKLDETKSSCGGRAPGEDIIDTLVSYYVGGRNEKITKYGDGVNATKKKPSDKWPYFAEPTPDAIEEAVINKIKEMALKAQVK